LVIRLFTGTYGSRALFDPELSRPSERLSVDPDPELRVWRRRSRPSDGLLDAVAKEHNDAVAIAKPKCANRSLNSNGRANIVAKIFSETGSRRTN
jgi:hypothetical protein